jgi:pyrophosphate--fructose-6-phosphate 1-phosphotransferase
MGINLSAEATRLQKVMDEHDCVNIFLSEGAGVQSIIEEMQARGEDIPRDAFGHVKLDKINPGQWFGKQFAERIGAEKVLVQKSGYYARSAPANEDDIALIHSCAKMAVSSAMAGVEGVIGQDEDHGQTMRAIEFSRIKGGKPFDPECDWFQGILKAIGQLP